MEHGKTVRMDEIEGLLAPAVAGAGYDLVRVQIGNAPGHGQNLQVMIERQDRRAMTVEDCAEMSWLVSALLDVEDPLPGNYTLEVTSPGIDRPLVRPEDYDRFAGFEAKIETAQPVAGRRRFRGRVRGRQGETVLIECADGPAEVPLAEIRRAALVLTDELIAATRDRAL
jgi:ribosome maturation factor RimP